MIKINVLKPRPSWIVEDAKGPVFIGFKHQMRCGWLLAVLVGTVLKAPKPGFCCYNLYKRKPIGMWVEN